MSPEWSEMRYHGCQGGVAPGSDGLRMSRTFTVNYAIMRDVRGISSNLKLSNVTLRILTT